jgi:hypothetical protein
MNSTFTGWPYPYFFAAPDAFDSRSGTRAVTATGAWNTVVRYRSSRSLDGSGIGAPPANPAGTFPGIFRGQDYSPTSGAAIEEEGRIPACLENPSPGGGLSRYTVAWTRRAPGALAKLYVEEAHSSAVREWVDEAEVVAVCRVAYPEAVSALTRRMRAGDLSKSAYGVASRALRRDWNRRSTVPSTAPLPGSGCRSSLPAERLALVLIAAGSCTGLERPSLFVKLPVDIS